MTTGHGDWFKSEMRFKEAVRASAELGRREVEDHRDAEPDENDPTPPSTNGSSADKPRRGPYVHPSSDQSSDRA